MSLSIAERRKAEAARMREKYPDRIPVIVEKAAGGDLPDIDKKILASSCEASSHPQPPAEHDRTSKEIAVES